MIVINLFGLGYMLFAAEDYKPNLIITAKIEIQGPGSTVKITNTQGIASPEKFSSWPE